MSPSKRCTDTWPTLPGQASDASCKNCTDVIGALPFQLLDPIAWLSGPSHPLPCADAAIREIPKYEVPTGECRAFGPAEYRAEETAR